MIRKVVIGLTTVLLMLFVSNANSATYIPQSALPIMTSANAGDYILTLKAGKSNRLLFTGDVNDTLRGDGTFTLGGGSVVDSDPYGISWLGNTSATDKNSLWLKFESLILGDVNVNSDWLATIGDSVIDNKPPLGTASPLDTGKNVGDVVIVEDLGFCSDLAYTDQASCISNSETWTEVAGLAVGEVYDGSTNNGNLSPTVNTVKKLNDAVDDLVLGGGGAVETVPYDSVTWDNNNNATDKNSLRDKFETFGTSSVLDTGQSIGNVVVVEDKGTCSNPIYVDQTTCEANSGTWTPAPGLSVIEIYDGSTNDGNLQITVNTLKKLNDAVDDLALGGALPSSRYAGLSLYSPATTVDVPLTNQNTWYIISVFDKEMSSSPDISTNLSTGAIIIGTDGDYKVETSIGFAGGNDDKYWIGFSTGVPSNLIPNIGPIPRLINSTGDVGAVAVSGIASLVSGDEVHVVMLDESAPGTSVRVSTINLSVVRVGETQHPPALGRNAPASLTPSISVDSLALNYTATDANGIAFVTYSLNGGTVTTLTNTSGDIYEATVTGFTDGGSDTLVIVATDGASNETSETLTVGYTAPTGTLMSWSVSSDTVETPSGKIASRVGNGVYGSSGCQLGSCYDNMDTASSVSIPIVSLDVIDFTAFDLTFYFNPQTLADFAYIFGIGSDSSNYIGLHMYADGRLYLRSMVNGVADSAFIFSSPGQLVTGTWYKARIAYNDSVSLTVYIDDVELLSDLTRGTMVGTPSEVMFCANDRGGERGDVKIDEVEVQ